MTYCANINYSNTLHRIAIALLYAYAFVIPFGTFLKFGNKHTSVGFGTVLLILFTFSRLASSIRILLNNKIFSIITLFLLYTLMVSACTYIFDAEYKVELAFYNNIYLLIYVAFAAATTSIKWDKTQLLCLALFLSAGIFISNILTIIDLLNLYDIPKFNESLVWTWGGEHAVKQVHGPFESRTAMAVYMTLFVPFLFLIGISKMGTHGIWLIFVSVLSFCILLLSHNRAGPIAIIITIFASIYFISQNKFTVLITSCFLVICLAIIISINMPNSVIAYTYNFSGSDLIASSDQIRLNLFFGVIESVFTNPLGMGFTNIYSSQYGWTDPHGVISSILYAGSIVGILWLVIFSSFLIHFVVIECAKYHSDGYWLALAVALLAWFLMSFMHNILYTGLFWLMFGIWISYSQPLPSKYNDTSPVNS